MIYLIGGAPRVGKSIVAKKIAEGSHATFVATDDICGKAAEGLTEEERRAKFPLPGFSDTASENTLAPENRVELQIITSKSLEPELDRVISEAIVKNESLVIEGVHLLPEHVRRLMAEHGAKKFMVLFVGSNDVDRVVTGIMKNTNPHNWTRNSDPEVIRQIAEFVAAFSTHIQKEAAQNLLPYQERTEDFEADMKRFYELLLGGDEIEL
ncbi:MAG: hypothetical protein WC641_03880 [Patescibacteria group bacterium]